MTITPAVPFRLVVEPLDDLLAATRACEAEVFLHTYGNSAQQLADEYGPYEATSHFLALVGPAGDVVGACRLIAPGPAGLKTVADVARAPWHVDGARALRAAGADPDRSWDVATIAVLPRRGVTPLASAALYHGLVQATRMNAIDWITMMLDERARRLLAAVGFVAGTLPGTAGAPYLGSACTTPLVGDVARMLDHQRRTSPEAHRLIGLGVGLDGVAVPSAEEFVIGARRPVPVGGRPVAARPCGRPGVSPVPALARTA